MANSFFRTGMQVHTAKAYSQWAMLATFLLFLGISLTGCDSEPAQRKAFITFLQTRIIAKPGVHIPRLTQEETKSLGDYTKQYAVITDFNSALDQSVSKPMKDMVNTRMIRTLPELMRRRSDIASLRDAIAKLNGAIDGQLARSDAAKAALKQPEDLKAVYDAAYAKTVTEPAKLMKDIFPALDETLDSAQKLADFIDKHASSIKLSGSVIEVSDPKIQEQVNALITTMTAKNQQIMDAQQRLRSMTGQ
jgi:Protein of unknown function (DUF3053)